MGAFQPDERLVVAAPLQVMRETGIDWVRQPVLKIDDGGRNLLQTRELTRRIAIAPRGVANNGKTIAQGRGEFVVDRSWLHTGKIACSGERLQSRPI
jgi:hypothetical protein